MARAIIIKMARAIIVITNFDKNKEKNILELLGEFVKKANIPINEIHWVIKDE